MKLEAGAQGHGQSLNKRDVIDKDPRLDCGQSLLLLQKLQRFQTVSTIQLRMKPKLDQTPVTSAGKQMLLRGENRGFPERRS